VTEKRHSSRHSLHNWRYRRRRHRNWRQQVTHHMGVRVFMWVYEFVGVVYEFLAPNDGALGGCTSFWRQMTGPLVGVAIRMLYAIRIYFIRAARATRPVAVARSWPLDLKNRQGGRKAQI